MRLFIAINFHTEIRKRLIALREELRSHSQFGKFSLDENLHLTLLFLGECDAKQTAAAKASMNAIGFEPINAVIDRVGRFSKSVAKPASRAGNSNGRRSASGGDIWWAGLREDRPLMSLQRELTERFQESGFILEKRKYSPHITLGRQIITNYSIGKIEPFGETVDKVDLMKSERIGGKLTYTAIYSIGQAK